MRKGVSPVVAIVLLIAIAVISAVAVWTWVGPLTAKPALGSTTFYNFQISRCNPTYSPTTSALDFKNGGGANLPTTTFSLISQADGSTLTSTSFTTTLPAGMTNSSLTVNYNLSSGIAYSLRASGIPDITFVC